MRFSPTSPPLPFEAGTAASVRVFSAIFCRSLELSAEQLSLLLRTRARVLRSMGFEPKVSDHGTGRKIRVNCFLAANGFKVCSDEISSWADCFIVTCAACAACAGRGRGRDVPLPAGLPELLRAYGGGRAVAVRHVLAVQGAPLSNQMLVGRPRLKGGALWHPVAASPCSCLGGGVWTCESPRVLLSGLVIVGRRTRRPD